MNGDIVTHLAVRLNQFEFVKHLQQIVNRFPDKEIILFLDHYPSHSTPFVNDFLEKHPQILIEWIPKYSPKLNPIEKIWKELKCNVGNWFYSTIKEMENAIRIFFRKLWYDKEKVISLTGFNEQHSI